MSDSLLHARPPAPAAPFRSRTRWGVEIGRLQFAVTRTREVEGTPPGAAPPPPRPAWPFAAGAAAGVGALALLVAGASAAPRDILSARYMVSVPIPPPAVRVARPAPRKPAATGRAVPRPAAASGEHFDAGDEPYVARAMATGAFQEWEDDVGQRRFLTAGPARAAGGRFCRDLALLVRFTEGGSHVRSAKRCTTGPISEPTPPTAVADDEAN